MASVRVYQKVEHIEKHGTRDAPWYVGWREPGGRRGRQRKKSFGPGAEAKRIATRFAKKLEAQLLLGQYESEGDGPLSWQAFREKFDRLVRNTQGVQNADIYGRALKQFTRVMKPNDMGDINLTIVQRFVAARRQESGSSRSQRLDRDGNPLISDGTIKKELTALRAVFRQAVEWGDIPAMPVIKMPRVAERIVTFVRPEEFAAMYREADQLTRPQIGNAAPGDWWRAILTTVYLTGWRIGQVLAIEWSQVDLEEKRIVAPGSQTKGRRTVWLPLMDVIAEHLAKIRSFEKKVFPWPLSSKRLLDYLHRLQTLAKLEPVDCQHYGWHDLRRGFATENAEQIDLLTLQKLMAHKSLETTRRYVNLAKSVNAAAAAIKVPDILRPPGNAKHA